MLPSGLKEKLGGDSKLVKDKAKNFVTGKGRKKKGKGERVP